VKEIIIDLNHIHTDSFKDEEFLHFKAKNKFLEILNENLNNISYFRNKKVHNTILVNGKRGYGKTSFILTIIEKLKNNNDIAILDVIDPTIIETKENMFLLVLSMVQKHLKNKDLTQYENKEIENRLRKLSKGLSILDNIGDGNIYQDPEIILMEGIENLTGGMALEKRFYEYIDYVLKVLDKKMFLLVFDDIDISVDKGKIILELIRKYFRMSKIQVVFLGDMELLKLITRELQWQKLEPSYIAKFEQDLISSTFVDEINILADQYFIKIFRNENIITLSSMYEVMQNDEIDIVVEKAKEKQKIEKYLDVVVENIFKETGFNKRLFVEYFLNLPLRNIIQILYNPNLETIKNIFYNNLAIRATKNLNELLNSLLSNKKDKFFKLYKYVLVYNNIFFNEATPFVKKDVINFDLSYLPNSENENENNLNLLFNAYIMNSIKNIKDICEIFIKFYIPLQFNINYNNDMHTFKLVRYLSAKSVNNNYFLGIIDINKQELDKINLTKGEQAIFNILNIGVFSNIGFKNYFSFWNVFGFISDIIFYGDSLNLKKLLQLKSFNFNDRFVDEKVFIQETEYNVDDIEKIIGEIKSLENVIIENLSYRQLNSIFIRIEYSIRYINSSMSTTLYEQLYRYIIATLNAFIIVSLESKKEIDFRNSIKNDKVFQFNKQVLEKYKDEYEWLWNFINLKLWDILLLEKYKNVKIKRINLINELLSLKISPKTKSYETLQKIQNKNFNTLYREDISNLIRVVKNKNSLYEQEIIEMLKEFQNGLPSKSKIKK